MLKECPINTDLNSIGGVDEHQSCNIRAPGSCSIPEKADYCHYVADFNFSVGFKRAGTIKVRWAIVWSAMPVNATRSKTKWQAQRVSLVICVPITLKNRTVIHHSQDSQSLLRLRRKRKSLALSTYSAKAAPRLQPHAKRAIRILLLPQELRTSPPLRARHCLLEVESDLQMSTKTAQQNTSAHREKWHLSHVYRVLGLLLRVLKVKMTTSNV